MGFCGHAAAHASNAGPTVAGAKPGARAPSAGMDRCLRSASAGATSPARRPCSRALALVVAWPRLALRGARRCRDAVRARRRAGPRRGRAPPRPAGAGRAAAPRARRERAGAAAHRRAPRRARGRGARSPRRTHAAGAATPRGAAGAAPPRRATPRRAPARRRPPARPIRPARAAVPTPPRPSSARGRLAPYGASAPRRAPSCGCRRSARRSSRPGRAR